MKLIVGLGNPGEEFENTRHNVGFLVLEKLKSRMTNDQAPITNKISNSKYQIPNNNQFQNFKYQKRFLAEVCDFGDVKLVKPQTFMNRSGVSVRRLVDFFKVELEDVWVIHDDLDIAWGEYKIEWAHGPKVHNGVNSVEEQLGSESFWRVRIGVDKRTKEDRIRFPGEKYVLMKLAEKERGELDGVIEKITEELVRRLGE